MPPSRCHWRPRRSRRLVSESTILGSKLHKYTCISCSYLTYTADMPKAPQFVAIRWPAKWRQDLKIAAAGQGCTMGLYIQRCFLCARAVGGLDALEALCRKHGKKP